MSGILHSRRNGGRPDGRRYEGEWLNGKQHGHGLYTNAKGEKREGQWINGKKEKWLDSGKAQRNGAR